MGAPLYIHQFRLQVEHLRRAAVDRLPLEHAVLTCCFVLFFLSVSSWCRKDKTFVAGGAAGKLLLNKKGWFGHDEVVLHKGEGPVTAIAWRCRDPRSFRLFPFVLCPVLFSF